MKRAKASPELCAFVLKQAPKHHVSDRAPDSWARLKDWHKHNPNIGTGFAMDSIPVHGGGCAKTIYPTPEVNHAFRAWHDMVHLSNGYSFQLPDEIRVGLIHMQQARRAGLSLVDQNMLVADTIGQIQYYHERGVYVDDQAAFVADVLDFGLRAVLDTKRSY